jgi:hypothetical protein
MLARKFKLVTLAAGILLIAAACMTVDLPLVTQGPQMISAGHTG